MRPPRLAAAILLASLHAQQTPAPGPLRVHPSNPRWFADPSGKAVLLTGSHVWQNLVDNGLIIPGATSNPPPVFEYTRYLDTLAQHNHNFFRLWRWEMPRWTDRYTGNEIKYAHPHPWPRVEPGNANDGAPKFDLSRFDESYFHRLRDRVTQARDRGMYVAVMLFEGWAIQFTPDWRFHPFHAANNSNGVEADSDGDGKGLEYTTLAPGDLGRRVLSLQEAYVRKVVDTVNDLDNVLYEICNESHGGSTDWQYHMIRFVKNYEAGKPRQHPVGMTFQYRGGANATLNASPADWISPNPGDARENYRTAPCADCSSKVVISDTDHLWGHTGGDSVWVWKSFTRGLNVLFMEEMLPSPTWQDSARTAMGQIRRMSQRLNLAAMKPEKGITSTGYCLAHRAHEYVIFQHDQGEFTVDLQEAKGARFYAEWLDVNASRIIPLRSVDGGTVRRFTTPFPGPAVLYLKRVN